MRDKKSLLKAFGEVTKELRVEHNLTQEKLAELAFLTDRSHVSDIERAEKGPVLATIFSIANAFGLSASELLRLVEQKLEQSS
jgi:transcriptional regulator with XRE-family HTH domain